MNIVVDARHYDTYNWSAHRTFALVFRNRAIDAVCAGCGRQRMMMTARITATCKIIVATAMSRIYVKRGEAPT